MIRPHSAAAWIWQWFVPRIIIAMYALVGIMLFVALVVNLYYGIFTPAALTDALWSALGIGFVLLMFYIVLPMYLMAGFGRPQ